MCIFPVRAGAILGGANEQQIQELSEYAAKIGLAFQIADDLLDETSTLEVLGKTPGKDKIAQKATYPRVYGFKESKITLHSLIEESCDIIKNSYNSELLLYITKTIETRIK